MSTAPWRGPVESVGSDRTPLRPELVLRWGSTKQIAAVVRREDRACLGFVYSVRRFGLDGWCNSWDERVWVTAELAANQLIRRQ